MDTVHRWVGISIVAALAILTVYGVVARLFRRRSLGRPFWGLLYYTETVLVAQVAIGVALLVIGRAVPNWLHYIYGSVFPVAVLVVGRLYSMRRDDYDYAPIALAAFVAFGLTARALMTGLGIG